MPQSHPLHTQPVTYTAAAMKPTLSLPARARSFVTLLLRAASKAFGPTIQRYEQPLALEYCYASSVHTQAQAVKP